MKIVFSGDRNSKTILFGEFIRKILTKKYTKIMLWDGYKSRIYFERGLWLWEREQLRERWNYEDR